MKTITQFSELAQYFADQFAQIPSVVAVGQGGSVTSGTIDKDSDIDLYVFTTEPIPVAVRQAIVDQRGASRADMNLTFWDPGDEWFDAPSGIEIDVMYWDPGWIADQIGNVLVHHYASMGYTTCHWHTMRNMAILSDPNNWLHAIKEKCNVPYPEELRQNIVTKNYPILRSVIPAYTHQIEKALKRGDLVSINHRIAALLASYFDIIFALNRVPHPGEKRLLERAASLCPQQPEKMVPQIETILQQSAGGITGLMTSLDEWLDNLDQLLINTGFEDLVN